MFPKVLRPELFLTTENSLRENPESSGANTVPLFVTQYSLSPKTAIGVQTRHYVDAFADWLHLYWVDYDPLAHKDKRSRKLENPLFSLATATRFYKYLKPVIASNAMFRTTFGTWWEENSFQEVLSPTLQRDFQHRVSRIYIAPIDNRDASRMRMVVQSLKRPFVLHLWDSLDCPLSESDDYRWLIQNAEQILTLSQPLRKDVAELGRAAVDLLFIRKPSLSLAHPPAGGRLKVALIGYLESYKPGVLLLDSAISNLRRKGLEIEMVYIGRQRSFDSLDLKLANPVTVTGFIPGDDGRDARLAECHIAYLPGPDLDPADDMRSRYSIPSRILDFMATGLPMVGTVHSGSATALLCRDLHLDTYLSCQTAEQIEDAISSLSNPQRWAVSHRQSLEALEKVDCDAQISTLRQALLSSNADPSLQTFSSNASGHAYTPQ